MLNDCWEWNGPRLRTGYGYKRLDGKTWLLHRYAWQWANGPIPDDKYILHKCNNRPCVNPSHLYAGTQKDNVADTLRSGNHNNKRKTHCPQGHPYDEENTRITKRGGRKCITCHKTRW